MSNNFYTASGTPGTSAFGSSGAVRSEFLAVQAGFDKMPGLSSGVANCAVIINSGGTGLTTTIGTLALAAAFATTGGFGTTLIEQAATSLTLPLTSDTLVGLATTDTLLNKTLVNAIVGTQSPGDNSTKAASTAYVDANLGSSGTFTPTDASGAGLTLGSPVGFYRKNGNVVHVWGSWLHPSTGNTAGVIIGGLPFASANLGVQDGFEGNAEYNAGGGTPGSHSAYAAAVVKNSTTFKLTYGGGIQLENTELAGFHCNFQFTYPV